MATKVIYDGDGEPHRYEIILHPATEGQDLLWELLAIAMQPGGAFVQALIEGDGLDTLISAIRAHMGAGDDGDEDAEDEADAADIDIVEILRGANFGTIGGDIQRTIMSTKMSPLARRLLAHTLRDDKPLDNDVHFNEAFTGNYGEYLRALLAAIDVNGFFALLGTSPGTEASKKETATSGA